MPSLSGSKHTGMHTVNSWSVLYYTFLGICCSSLLHAAVGITYHKLVGIVVITGSNIQRQLLVPQTVFLDQTWQ